MYVIIMWLNPARKGSSLVTLVERSLATSDFRCGQSDTPVDNYRIPHVLSSHIEVGLKKAIEIAVKTLGYSKARPIQETVMQKFMFGFDVFVSLPTF